MSEKKKEIREMYYIIDWEMNEIHEFSERIDAEEWLNDEAGEDNDEAFTIIKGKQLNFKTPVYAKIED